MERASAREASRANWARYGLEDPAQHALQAGMIQQGDHVVLTGSALGNQEVAIVFKPREEWPRMYKFLKLYREATAA